MNGHIHLNNFVNSSNKGSLSTWEVSTAENCNVQSLSVLCAVKTNDYNCSIYGIQIDMKECLCKDTCVGYVVLRFLFYFSKSACNLCLSLTHTNVVVILKRRFIAHHIVGDGDFEST